MLQPRTHSCLSHKVYLLALLCGLLAVLSWLAVWRRAVNARAASNTPPGAVFSQAAALAAADGEADDEFGSAVALDGDTLVVGVRNADAPRSNQGAAYVFARHAGGPDNWGLVKKLTASDGASSDGFGGSVAVSGHVIVVGADGDNVSGVGGSRSNQGSAYVFERDAGGAGNWGQVQKLVASDGAENDHFAVAVSISGDALVVGADGADVDGDTDAGAAYVFVRDPGGALWREAQRLTAPDGAAESEFGEAVAVSGHTAVIGAAHADVGRNANQGAAYVFARGPSTGRGWEFVKKLTAEDGARSDAFGVAVAAGGNTVVVGADGADVNRVTNQGAAYLFERDAGGPDNWGQAKKFIGLSSERSAGFGSSVSLDGDLIAVGAPVDDVEGGEDQGVAYLFARNEGGAGRWGLVKQLTAAEGVSEDELGTAVAVSGGTVVAGAPGVDLSGSEDWGAAYVFTSFPLALRPEVLFSGTVGADYFQPLSVSGGDAPYGFAVTKGGLPRGLLLNGVTGLISGVPEATGKTVFTVTASDAAGAQSVSAYAMTIHCPMIALGPARLPDARAVRSYRQAITVTTTPTSAAPFSFKVVSGSLPAGLALDGATGVIAGTPRFIGTYRFTVEARDRYGCGDSRSYALRVSF